MFTYGFYNSVGGDRRYNAEQFTSIFDGVIADGVFQTVGDFLATVKNGGMQVLVKSGRAWFNHTWNLNDAPIPLTLDDSDVLRTRIDAVVLEVNSTIESRENSIKIVKGTPSTNPTKPTLKNDAGIYQHALSYVTVLPGATEIKDENIEIVVGKEETPFVTSPIKTVPIDDLFNRWDGEFNTWFENLKAQLSDDVVGNLQKQIDEKVNLADKATAEDIQNGTPGKWVDASLVGLAAGAKIGDIVYTTRNLELETNGEFIACDGRTVLLEAYPDLDKNELHFPYAIRLTGYYDSTSFRGGFGGLAYNTSSLNNKDYIYFSLTKKGDGTNFYAFSMADKKITSATKIEHAIRVSDDAIIVYRDTSTTSTSSIYAYQFIHNDCSDYPSTTNSIFHGAAAESIHFYPLKHGGVFYFINGNGGTLGAMGALGFIDTDLRNHTIGTLAGGTFQTDNAHLYGTNGKELQLGWFFEGATYFIKGNEDKIWFKSQAGNANNISSFGLVKDSESGKFKLSDDTKTSLSRLVVGVSVVNLIDLSIEHFNLFDDENFRSDLILALEKEFEGLTAIGGFSNYKNIVVCNYGTNMSGSPGYCYMIDEWLAFTLGVWHSHSSGTDRVMPCLSITYNVLTKKYSFSSLRKNKNDASPTVTSTTNYNFVFKDEFSKEPLVFYSKKMKTLYGLYPLNSARSLNLETAEIKPVATNGEFIPPVYMNDTNYSNIEFAPYPYGDDLLYVFKYVMDPRRSERGESGVLTSAGISLIRDGILSDCLHGYSFSNPVGIEIKSVASSRSCLIEEPVISNLISFSEYKGDLYYMDNNDATTVYVIPYGSKRIIPYRKNGYMKVLTSKNEDSEKEPTS